MQNKLFRKDQILSTTILSNESGRSMVEMLGVLSVVGVLSVGGVVGYRTAMDSHHASQTVDRIMKRAAIVSPQRMLGQAGDISGFSATDGAYQITLTPTQEGDATFTLNASGVPQKVCEKIKGYDWKLPVIIPGECGETNDMSFTFNNDLSDNGNGGVEPEKPCTDGKVKCTGGYYYVCEGGKWVEKQALESNQYCDGDTIADATGWDNGGCRDGFYLPGGEDWDQSVANINSSEGVGKYYNMADLPDGKACVGDQLVDAQKRCVNGEPQFSTDDGESWQPYTFGHCEYCNGDEIANASYAKNGNDYAYGCYDSTYTSCTGTWEAGEGYEYSQMPFPEGKVCDGSWLRDAQRRCVNGQPQVKFDGGEWQSASFGKCEYCNGDELDNTQSYEAGWGSGSYSGCHNSKYKECSGTWDDADYPTPAGKICIDGWLVSAEQRCVNGQPQYRLSGGEWQDTSFGKCEYCNGDELINIGDGSNPGCHNGVYSFCSYGWEAADAEYNPIPEGKVCVGSWLLDGQKRCVNGQPQQKIGNGNWETYTLMGSEYCSGDQIAAADSYNLGCHNGLYTAFDSYNDTWNTTGSALPDGKVCVDNWLTDGEMRCLNGQPQQKIGNGDWTNYTLGVCQYCNGDKIDSAANSQYGCYKGDYIRCDNDGWVTILKSLPSGKICVDNWLTNGETRCVDGQPQQKIGNGDWTNTSLTGCQFCNGNAIATANYYSVYGCHDGTYRGCDAGGSWKSYSPKLPSGKMCSGNWLKNK